MQEIGTNPLSFLINNYLFLQQNFKGVFFSITPLMNLASGIAVSLYLIILSFVIGRILRNIFFKNTSYEYQTFLIEIVLGYLLISSGIALLGFFSLLYPSLIYFYLSVLTIITALFLYAKKDKYNYLTSAKKILKKEKNNKLVLIFIFLFIVLAFLKLQTPETREDQYHVDLAAQYLSEHSTMLSPKEELHVLSIPQLGEMFYVISLLFNTKESTRYIHFVFYILTLSCLYFYSKNKKYSFAILAPLLFASAPEVIRETSSPYVDFQWILPLLLGVYILIKEKLNRKDIFLAGIMFGTMLAAKLWTIAFFPLPIIYLIIRYRKSLKTSIYFSLILFAGQIIVSFLWYLRSFLLTGNPVFPAFYRETNLENVYTDISLSNFIGINSSLFSFSYINVFNPIFYLGTFLLILRYKDSFLHLKKLYLSLFFLLFLLEIIFINYPFGRYLLGIFSIATIVVSLQLYKIILKNKIFKYGFYAALFLIFFYYLLNTLLLIPYQYGWADKNKYLTRVLSRDNSSYYDFDNLFDKHISKNDLVATYKLFGFYYANFNHIDINYIFDKNNKSFDMFKKKGVTKLVINGGDINWFCKKLNLSGCSNNRYEFIASYSGNFRYMYAIK